MNREGFLLLAVNHGGHPAIAASAGRLLASPILRSAGSVSCSLISPSSPVNCPATPPGMTMGGQGAPIGCGAPIGKLKGNSGSDWDTARSEAGAGRCRARQMTGADHEDGPDRSMRLSVHCRPIGVAVGDHGFVGRWTLLARTFEHGREAVIVTAFPGHRLHAPEAAETVRVVGPI